MLAQKPYFPQKPYFHGSIDLAEAECRLRQHFGTGPGTHANPDGRFLVREKRPDGPGTRTSYVMTLVFRADRSRRIMVEHPLAQRARRTDNGQGNRFIVDGKIRISGHRSMVSLVAELIADPNVAHAAVISSSPAGQTGLVRRCVHCVRARIHRRSERCVTESRRRRPRIASTDSSNDSSNDSSITLGHHTTPARRSFHPNTNTRSISQHC